MKRRGSVIPLLLWPIVASVISILMNANFFVSTVIFLGIPSVYLSFLNKEHIKKLGIFSILFAIPICLVVDYIMEATGGWYVPQSLFGSFRLFDFVTADLVLWGFLEAYFILMFYETYLDKKFKPKLYHPNLKYLFILFYLSLSVFVLFYIFNPSILQINYFYLKMGIVMAVFPVLGMLLKFPRFLNRYLNIAAYFFIFNIVYEITAVKLHQWSFPVENQLIGIVDFMGVRFAFEELIFWMILTAMSVVSFYEVFDDDLK